MDKSEQEKAQEFISAYNALCEKYGYSIRFTPVFYPTNHGTFEIGQKMEAVKSRHDPI
jgi:hypothetical protein